MDTGISGGRSRCNSPHASLGWLNQDKQHIVLSELVQGRQIESKGKSGFHLGLRKWRQYGQRERIAFEPVPEPLQEVLSILVGSGLDTGTKYPMPCIGIMRRQGEIRKRCPLFRDQSDLDIQEYIMFFSQLRTVYMSMADRTQGLPRQSNIGVWYVPSFWELDQGTLRLQLNASAALETGP